MKGVRVESGKGAAELSFWAELYFNDVLPFSLNYSISISPCY